ncbi:hypothetical protein [Haloimpatiens myeolchijeotgali]|uniref:hypothetical protein n=1 Tax=Haloimpatiens sp. FM7330 TaxID=3298610 RepID=UPI00384CE756
MIYTSLNKNFPWYEPCGIQFLSIILISAPILLITGIVLMILNKKNILPKVSSLVSFYALAGITLPIIIDGSLSKITIFTGTILCIVFIVLTVLVSINNFNKIKKI